MAFKMKSGNGTSFKQMGSSPTPQKVYGGGYTDETDPKEAQREKEREESLKTQEAAKAAGKGAAKAAISHVKGGPNAGYYQMNEEGVKVRVPNPNPGTSKTSALPDLQPGMDPDHAHPIKQTTTTTKYNKKGIGKRGKTITYTKESGTDKRGNDKGVSKKITKTDGAGNEYNIYAGKGGRKSISSKKAARQMNRQDRRVNRGKQTKGVSEKDAVKRT